MYFKDNHRSTLPVYLTVLSISTRTTAKNDRIISEYWLRKGTEISDFNVFRYSLRHREEYKEQQLLPWCIFGTKPSDLRSSVKPHQSTCLVMKLQWLTTIFESYYSTSLTQMSLRVCSNWIPFTFTHHMCCITCFHIVETVEKFITCLLCPSCVLFL